MTYQPETLYVECACGSPEHLLKFQYHPDEEDPALYTSTFLSHWLPWYKRAWVAFKYVFKIGSERYGHFDCTLIEEKDLQPMIDLCQKVLDDRRKVVNK